MTDVKIWIVADGEYSDYHVVGVFATEDDAKAAVEAGVGDEYTSWTVQPAGQPPKKVITWMAAATLDGTRVEREPHAWSWTSWDCQTTPPLRPRSTIEPLSRGRSVIRAEARSKDGALKSVADRLAKLRAEREGL